MEMNINDEVFLQISGFSNYYVSNFGRVKNLKTQRILKGIEDAYGYLKVTIQGRNLYIHRLVALHFFENPDEKLYIDHIDGNRKNNHVSNLRFATSSENSMNRAKIGNTSSIYKGVCFHIRKNKWIASIMIDGKSKHLGYFENEEDAGLAYNKKAIELFGAYAKLNPIEYESEELTV
jgi:3'-phosphoadenosine 5'-phosphosulfate sulfotransferase